MKFFKQNPIFTVFTALFILLFVAGVFLILKFSGEVTKEKEALQRAETSLRGALSLQPAPTDENIQAAEANIANLEKALEKQIEATRGEKPRLLSGKPPASGTEMLFQLEAYKNEFAREAKRTVPINVADNELEIMKEFGTEIPGVELPQDFAFGFSRYIDSGTPPADAAVPVIYMEKEILTFILRKLLNTRPISIVAVDREPVEIDFPKADPNANPRSSNNQKGPALNEDEFLVGSETARVEGAVKTYPFKVVFTGYTVNLRSFLKQIEEFEIPLVVRSVEVAPRESSVRVANNNGGGSENNLFSMLGESKEKQTEQIDAAEVGKEPIVSENESEFTVVIEFINATVDQKSSDKEDLS